ncbi:MAG: hydrogenobyrinic acid a,c-diamide synthase (glutamine-hydrolyzing) [Methanocorpusculum sp.]|nr:hydrogenobyrinic acid a,c-diamide synthase (glutamine-hydrolyzing) [Methanocorpusculum sp.]
MKTSIPRIIIAGTHSGCGKTTTSSGIMAALRARGLVVQPFKVGPDFIDPSHHSVVCGRESRNLDPFMMGEDSVRRSFISACEGADIAVIEGVMGLYDGVDGGDMSSSAHVARILDAPVVLVTDIKGMSRSVLALIKGYKEFDPRIRFAGVIMTKGGGEKHKAMTTGELTVPLLGWIPRCDMLAVESRHLGLMMGSEDSRMKDAGAFIEEHCSLDELLSAAANTSEISAESGSVQNECRARIGVAMDEAFCFYYRDNFDYLRNKGAELVFFSPIHDHLPEADAYYFGGGYPELYGESLANSFCKAEIKRAADSGRPVFGECGGLMWLNRSITTQDGHNYKMTGLLDADCIMENRFVALNYVVGKVTEASIIPAGTNFRGHEFHYSRTVPDADVRFSFTLERGDGICDGKDGITAGSVLGGYTHMYFGATHR